MLVLTHFSGHEMAGFSGAVENLSMGLASAAGKPHIRSGGADSTMWGASQEAYLNSMAEAGQSVADTLEGQLVYINVLTQLSIDCDCGENPAQPEMADTGGERTLEHAKELGLGSRGYYLIMVGAAILTLTLCLMFGALLLKCMKPMEDRTYDLSLIWAGEAMPEGWVCDPKGWTVFTQEGEVVTELVPNGSGGFDRLDELGQTFYFSRLLSEDVDSPTLRLDATIRSVAVFLDGALIYTDCPELDHRIGNLCLPMLDWVREEPVLVTLPQNYAGKTLTIAQSTDPYGGELQKPSMTVWPCAVTLYCGYAYESALVAESFQTAVPTALAFAAGTLLLALFLWQVFQGRLALDALCGGLTAFFWLAGRLSLAFRLTGRRRGVICFCAGVQGATVAVNITMQITEQLTFYLALSVPAISLAGLTAALVMALAEAVHREITRRTEERLLAQRFELAQSSNEALRRQNEQVMMLRHDMIKHFRVLRQMVTDEKTAAYFG